MYTDNLTYGASTEGKTKKSMTLYELPVSSTLQNQKGHSETDSELAGSTYAVPNMYEYATFGPDKMVIIIVMTIVVLVKTSNSY